jgi:PKD repeat protein
MQLPERLKLLRHRLRFRSACEQGLQAAAWLLNAVALVCILQRVQTDAADTLTPLWWLPITAAAAVAVGAFSYRRLRLSLEDVALLVDQRAHLQEAAVTALTESGPFDAPLHANLERRFTELENERLIPGPRWRWAGGLIIPMLVLLMLTAFPNARNATAHWEVPLAVAHASTTRGAAPLSVTLRALRTEPGVSYDWFSGETSLGSGATLEIVLSEPGQVPIRLVAKRGEYTDQDRLPSPIDVRPPELPTAEFTVEPRQGPAPLTVSYRARTTEAIRSVQWTLDGDPIGTDAEGTVTLREEGDHNLTLTVTGDAGRDEATAVIRVTPGSAPTARFNASPRSGRGPLAVQFTGAFSEGVIDEFTWDFGDGTAPGHGLRPTHTYDAPGVYTVALTVRGPGGEDTRVRKDYIVVTAAPISSGLSGSGGLTGPAGGTEEDGTDPDVVHTPIDVDPLLGEGAHREGTAPEVGEGEDAEARQLRVTFRKTVERALRDRDLLPGDRTFLQELRDALK